MAGSGTGRTPDDDPAHDTADNTPTVSDNEPTVNRVKRRPALRALFISAFSP
jgi:hypothetical protein